MILRSVCGQRTQKTHFLIQDLLVMIHYEYLQIQPLCIGIISYIFLSQFLLTQLVQSIIIHCAYFFFQMVNALLDEYEHLLIIGFGIIQIHRSDGLLYIQIIFCKIMEIIWSNSLIAAKSWMVSGIILFSSKNLEHSLFLSMGLKFLK